jgi:aryl-alcohol dehydrogenase-like predicted oxidoreductase
MVYHFHVVAKQKNLIIGTANFGNAYGVSKNQIKMRDIERVIGDAISRENVFIETSSSYIGSERIIGQFLTGVQFENLIVKVTPENYSKSELFLNSLQESLIRLNQKSADLVMLHGIGQALTDHAEPLKEAFSQIKQMNLALKIGLSCYLESEISAAKSIFPEIEAFQIPENVIDRRKYNSTYLNHLREQGNRIQVRSLFLQGLLTEAFEYNEDKYPGLIAIRNELNSLALSMSLSLSEICLNYGKSIEWATDLVLGVQNFDQYYQNLKIIENTENEFVFDITQGNDFLVDPRNWS